MNSDGAYTSLGKATGAALRRSVGTRPRQWLITSTLLAGLLTAVGLSMTAPPAGKGFAALTETVQLLMSAPAPFLGALLTGDLRKAPHRAHLIPSLLAAMVLAAAVGVFGILVCALTLAIATSGSGADPWLNMGIVTVGSVLLQIDAQLVGTGLGLLLRSPVVACLGTIVLPMGLWVVLGGIEVLQPAQAWLTPYATARNLLSGQMNPLTWTQWFVILLIWGVGLNTAGAALLRRKRHGHEGRDESGKVRDPGWEIQS
ncbi:hypothetical protein [Sphaerisporangium dianthi]|uniref:ABC transporter permease n=1 Tax=Sphaerisporangium dianthi TaxID=1436120 RepID=A0ABV9CE59_9ACTN